MSIKQKAKELKKQITVVYYALRDKRCPWYARAMCALTVAYALSPIDLIPDFIPVLGYLDDIIILPIMIMLSVRFIPGDVMIRARSQAEKMPEKKWYFAIPVILLWLLIIGAIIYKIA